MIVVLAVLLMFLLLILLCGSSLRNQADDAALDIATLVIRSSCLGDHSMLLVLILLSDSSPDGHSDAAITGEVL
jgi:hypothetical protein